MSKKSGKHSYTIGYGRPPVHSRFKPGQSGNPAGRCKGQPSLEEAFAREARRRVKVKTASGGIEQVTKLEVSLRQLFNLSMQGNIAATRIILAYTAAPAQAGEGSPQEDAGALFLGAKPNPEMIARFFKRFQHLIPDKETS
jgi:hypothetical protein